MDTLLAQQESIIKNIDCKSICRNKVIKNRLGVSPSVSPQSNSCNVKITYRLDTSLLRWRSRLGLFFSYLSCLYVGSSEEKYHKREDIFCKIPSMDTTLPQQESVIKKRIFFAKYLHWILLLDSKKVS